MYIIVIGDGGTMPAIGTGLISRPWVNICASESMGQLIYAFIYTVDRHSKVARAHPDWIFSGTLDMSNPAVVKHLENQLDEFVRRFGPFEWRNDSVLTVPHGSDDTPLLGQDQGFREILRDFLDRHPG